jgi:hypothetical protein
VNLQESLGYWIAGFAAGFQLWQKLPPWFLRVWKVLVVLSLLPICAMLASSHGCTGVRMHGARMADSAAGWRPLPALLYIKPDAKNVTLALPQKAAGGQSAPRRRAQATEQRPASVQWGWQESPSITTSSSAIAMTMPGISTSTSFSSATTLTSCSSISSGTVICQLGSTATLTDSHMVEMKTYPASARPSRCVASCTGCHRHVVWEAPVEERYCDGDHSDDHGPGIYGWLKSGDVWRPALWPAFDQTDSHQVDRNEHTLTEGTWSK